MEPLDCQQCGACCASFRVDFSIHELQSWGGQTPDGLAEVLSGQLCRMRGTDYAAPRCAALYGKVGSDIQCAIYEYRPSPCRKFEAGSDACLQARKRHHVHSHP